MNEIEKYPPPLTGGYSEENWKWDRDNIGYSCSIDWLQLTYEWRDGTFWDLLPNREDFTIIAPDRGMHSYTEGWLLANGVKVMLAPDNREMGVHLIATGSVMRGLRESLGGDNGVLKTLCNEKCRRVTRLDIAGDLLGLEKVMEVIEVANKEGIKTRLKPHSWHKDWAVENGGLTAYFGSPASEYRVRVYDKAVQMRMLWAAWTRVEHQLRGDVSTKAVKTAVREVEPIGALKSMVNSRFMIESEWYKNLMGSQSQPLEIPHKEPNYEKWLMETVLSGMAKRYQNGLNRDTIETFYERLALVIQETNQNGR